MYQTERLYSSNADSFNSVKLLKENETSRIYIFYTVPNNTEHS